MMEKIRQVIVGNSAAGINAIRAIRESNRPCDIVLVSAEKCNAYSPVMITHYLSGEISVEQMFIVDSHFYEENDVETIFGDKAIGLEPSKQIVHLESGMKVTYDNLLIATGTSPRSLPGEPIEASNVLSVWTLGDAEKVSELAKKAREIIVIGGGLIGLQVADALCKDGVQLTILESLGQILSRNADADCAKIIQDEMESRGVSILCSVNVTGIENRGEKAVVILDSDQELAADMVIINIGVDANIGWLQGSGIRVNRGVLVDEFMRATFGNIFAAGDVTEIRNVVTGQTDVLPGWGAACIQGRVAGANMVGQPETYPGSLMENITTLFGLPLATVGLVRATDGYSTEEIQFSDPQQIMYRKILVGENRIVGAILLGMAEDAGVIRNLILNKVDVSIWKDEIAKTPMELRNLFINQLTKPWSLF